MNNNEMIDRIAQRIVDKLRENPLPVITATEARDAEQRAARERAEAAERREMQQLIFKNKALLNKIMTDAKSDATP